jgi:hypothetical protein
MELAQQRAKWGALVNMLIKLLVQQKTGGELLVETKGF